MAFCIVAFGNSLPILSGGMQQGNTVIKSELSQRDEAFTDVNVNLRESENGAAANGESQDSTQPSARDKPQTDGRSPSSQNGAAKAPVSDSNWTDEQELALVKALKQYGKELDNRWELIAKAVPGQNKTSCLRRFKQLRQSVRANKS